MKALIDKYFILGQDEVPAYVRLESGESLRWTLVALPGHSSMVNLEFDLAGPGAGLDLAGLYLCTSDEELALNITVRHSSGGCVSRQMFKGIVGGKAKASFDGLIYVAQDSQKTRAYQESHTILLSETAVAEARPQLEIYADDVECSHGATSGYLDADQLFYMRSRGIEEAEAKRLQIISFLAPVLERLPEGLRDDIISQCQA